VGHEFKRLALEMLVAVGAWPLLRLGGMPQAEYDDLVAGARAELERRELKIYMNL
jgi:hypothetical protein